MGEAAMDGVSASPALSPPYVPLPIGPDRSRVTSADFNGFDWDGSPFEPLNGWLLRAYREGTIAVDRTSGSYDYAVWRINGDPKLLAFPGDVIVRDSITGKLSLDQHSSNKTR